MTRHFTYSMCYLQGLHLLVNHLNLHKYRLVVEISSSSNLHTVGVQATRCEPSTSLLESTQVQTTSSTGLTMCSTY